MKYVRTKNSIREIINDYGNSCAVKSDYGKTIDGFTIIHGLTFAPRADSIEELCDNFVMELNTEKGLKRLLISYPAVGTKYGAIWTDRGLRYVAKMNDEGELELL